MTPLSLEVRGEAAFSLVPGKQIICLRLFLEAGDFQEKDRAKSSNRSGKEA